TDEQAGHGGSRVAPGFGAHLPLPAGAPRPVAERLSRTGLLAPGSSPPPRLPASRLGPTQWLRGARLPGHSCGGSPGLAPGSLAVLGTAARPAGRSVTSAQSLARCGVLSSTGTVARRGVRRAAAAIMRREPTM